MHTGKLSLKCDVCDRSFDKKSELTKQLQMHNTERLFKCNNIFLYSHILKLNRATKLLHT